MKKTIQTLSLLISIVLLVSACAGGGTGTTGGLPGGGGGGGATYTLAVTITDTTGSSGDYIATLWQNGDYTGWLSENQGASNVRSLTVDQVGTFYVTAYRDVNGNNSYDTGEPSSPVGVVTYANPSDHNLSLFLF